MSISVQGMNVPVLRARSQDRTGVGITAHQSRIYDGIFASGSKM